MHAHNNLMAVTPPADHRQVIVTPLLDHVGLADTVLNDERSVKITAPVSTSVPQNNGGARINGIACK